jgi:hypothetical protein
MTVSVRFFGFALFAAAGLLASCTDFFSSSLAPWAARDPASLIPPVTAGNVQDLIAQAENDPNLSLTVLRRIKEAKAKASGEELSRLQASALTAAVNATGLGSSLLSKAGEITSVIGDAEKAKGLVVSAINGMSNLAETSELLGDILPAPGDDGAFQSFVDAADSESLVMSTAVLLAAESQKHGDAEEYIENFDPQQTLTPSERLTVDLAEAAVVKIEDEGAQGPLGDVLSGLNLAPKDIPPIPPFPILDGDSDGPDL